jgi:biopolymer transport protein ExbD
MAVAVGGSDEKPMSDINTTPLVDVMLVLLIIFLIAVPVAIQTIQKLKIPVIPTTESKDKVENLLVTVSTTDAGGRSAGDPGFEGASLGGECRVYFNNITPMDSVEFRDQAYKRLDALVKRAGGAEALKDNPEMIPQVHLRADVVAPWRCVAGVIYNTQISGYPSVAFITNPVDPNG